MRQGNALHMRTHNEIRKALGMTQQSMALLLGVSRSHLAYYELGKRNLPSHAWRVMNELVTHVFHKSTVKDLGTITPNREKMAKNLLLQLDENDLRQKVLAKQIRIAEQKHLDHLRRSEFAKQAAEGHLKDNRSHPVVTGYLASISSDDAIAESMEQLSALYFKREWLEHDQLFLQSQLDRLQMVNEKQL